MSDLAILVPVLGRPAAAAPLVANIHAETPGTPRVVFICDTHDFAEQKACRATGAQVMIIDGGYATKINGGARTAHEPLLFLGADDLHFHRGWLDEATARMTRGIQVVGTNDLGNNRVVAGRHATHSLVTRDYLQRGTIDEPGKLLHEGYHHNFCDDEFVCTAKKRNVWAHAGRSIVEHCHPNWGKAEDDATYRHGMKNWEGDRRLFLTRRQLWR